ncbi:hypothetical protein F4604DRAFT_1885178 [Suillus subluteus]|nr:hypothetical protein F4604DRAFT_1885178 [Suillus subluteus]
MWRRASGWSLALIFFIFLLAIVAYMSENMQLPQRQFNAFQVPCGHAGCKRYFKTTAGRTKHVLSAHPIVSSPPPEDHVNNPVDQLQDDADFSNFLDPASGESRSSPSPHVHTEFYGPGDKLYRNYHTLLDGHPCDKHGNFLPDGMPPPPTTEPKSCNDWTPFRNRVKFETAEFLYIQNQMPANQADRLLNLWATTLLKHGESPPFADHQDLYATIDSIPLGEVKWQGFSCTYSDEKPDGSYPPWMDGSYDVWYRDPREVVRNMLANPAYSDEMDYRPYREYSTDGDERQFRDLMSADWAWEQADIIAGDPETLGSTFVPIILGSDKTTVSVATGNNEYYPLYLSIGNVHNNVRRAHRDAVAIIGFLAMPKTTKEYAQDPRFRAFRRQLFHCSLSRILNTLKSGMTKPKVAKFGDGHFRRVIYGLGPYIADYEEQVLLACIVRHWCTRCCTNRKDLDADLDALLRCRDHTEALVDAGTYAQLWLEFGIISDLVPFTNDFPRADIYRLIALDLLHQIIKGAFKDHLVSWVEIYIMQTHGKRDGLRILDDIDHRIAAVASFAGLRRFPQGRGFKQWTGDDSKALMKVYLAAIEGHVPQAIVRAFRAFLEFCYLVRRNTITESTLAEIQDALSRYHQHRTIFVESGAITTFSLPRQHSLVHYIYLIRQFGAPNGLCSSITESKHIKAVKEPWRRSSKYNALGQMLVTNQRLDKLAAARVDFANRGMLDSTCLAAELEALAPHDTERNRARNVLALAEELNLPRFPDLIRRFLFEQTCRPDDDRDSVEIPLAGCPRFEGQISVFNSASSRFYAPSDISGIGGMRVEHIRACPLWRNEAPRNDCIFINIGSSTEGIRGLEVARVCAFFSFKYGGEIFPCAIVRWFDVIGDSPDEDTGMWMVRPAYGANRAPLHSIVHVETIYCAAHLIPIYGTPYYVNKYVDHHAFEIAS